MKKLLMLFSIVLLIGTGCIEEEKTYTKIYTSYSASIEVYDYYGNYLGGDSFSDSDTIPYTDYDWNYEEPIEEAISSFITNYNYIETEYDKVDRPTPDKIVGRARVKVYMDDSYGILSIVYTATRY
jgi:hypothetical protein